MGVGVGEGVMEGVAPRESVDEGVCVAEGVALQLGATLSPVAAHAAGQGQAIG